MRDLILKMSISMDGLVGSLDGRNDWMFGGDREAKAWSVETIWNASLHIMGSRTFRDMAAYWPTSTDVFAPPMNQIPKVVFSRRALAIVENAKTMETSNGTRGDAGIRPSEKPQPGAESWAAAHVASGDLAEEIVRLKVQEGRPIIAHGGASFARGLISRNLVDRFVLLVHPVLLGRGLPIFSELAAPVPLKLLSSRAFPGGSVAQIYRVA